MPPTPPIHALFDCDCGELGCLGKLLEGDMFTCSRCASMYYVIADPETKWKFAPLESDNHVGRWRAYLGGCIACHAAPPGAGFIH